MPDEKPAQTDAERMAERLNALEEKFGMKRDERTPRQKQDDKLAARKRH